MDDRRITRRALMGAMVAGGMFAMTDAAAKPAAGSKFFGRKGPAIGLQLYTLGDEPVKDLDGTLAKVAALGYRDLELPSLFGKSPAELRAAAGKAGVAFTSVHLPAAPNMPKTALSMMSEPQRIVDDLGAMGVRSAVMPIMLFPSGFRPGPGETFQAALARSIAAEGPDLWKKTAALLNEKAAALKPHGIEVGYHNHNVEFAKCGEATGWDILAKECDAALVKFEVDVGWIAAAGLDPATFLARHAGRVRWIHVKDLKATTRTNFALQMDPVETGDGKQDWAKILPAAKKAGVRHFYVEQEPPFAMERMAAITRSYAYLSALRI